VSARHGFAAALAFAAAGLGAPAQAFDRPYLSTSNAAAEEDDDQAWSFETWATRAGSVRTIAVAPEYAFSPTTTLQLELTSVRVRDSGMSMSLADLEFKHLFNHIARDGYGWGVVLSPGVSKTGSQAWRREEWSAKGVFSLALWEGEGMLHLNAGVAKPRDDRREWTGTLALERALWKRTTLFAELAREGEARLAHGGVRYWLKREKFALDLAWQRQGANGAHASGWVFGLGWYDL
jgi:hypothetical protein